jgi:hypothetical protein
MTRTIAFVVTIAISAPLLAQAVHLVGPGGSPFTLEFRAQPGAMVGVFASLSLGMTSMPGFDQTLLLGVANVFALENLIADPAGLAVGTWSVPALPALRDLAVWFQGFTGPNYPLQASGISGGLVR